MPRGNPKRPTALRLDPELVAEVRAHTDNLSAAIEDALRLWLRRVKATTRRRDGRAQP